MKLGKNLAFSVVLLLGAWATPVLSAPVDPATIKAADALREEKSYQLAIPQYEAILRSQEPDPGASREIKFKLADCLWRANDETRLEEAKKTLKEIIESPDHDPWWAEANESLAQLYISQDRWTFQNDIKQAFENARDYWAGSTDLKRARKKFVQISFDYGDYITQNFGWSYNVAPLSGTKEVYSAQPQYGLHSYYRELLKLVDNELDRAKATYALGMCYLTYYANEKEQKLAEKYLREVIEKYKESEWVDDAYYQLGQYYERANDFPKALEIYREYVAHFRIGDSQWVDNANQRIKDITETGLQVSVGYNFLPGSEVQFQLGWRNVDAAQVTFYKLDLVDALQLNPLKTAYDSDRGAENYNVLLKNLVESHRLGASQVALTWNKKLKNEGKYQWYYENKGLAEWQLPDAAQDKKEPVDPKTGILPPGAYLLLVSAGGKEAYDLVVVGDLGLVSKTAGHTNLFFVFDGKTGEPKKGARVKFHYRYYDDSGNWAWEEGSGSTDENGLLNVPLKTTAKSNYSYQHNVFAVASDGTSQAFAQSNYYYGYYNQSPWWIYAFSDRPAYRPNEEVSFKGIIRQQDGTTFTTPSGVRLKGRIYDPMGNQVQEKVYILNNFGSFNDTLTLDEKAPLGEYRLELWTEDMQTSVGNATVFRLEEYKLPEFTVTIKPKPLEEKKQTGSVFKLGDTVTVELDAQYYFGGPVANADVEYLIYQNYYYHYYYPVRDYPWYYEQSSPNYYYDKGTLITQGKIKTTAEGKAIFTFDTPQGSGNDLKYVIEARVVDQSRREISASSEVKVMRSSYFAYLTPKRNLYRPGDKAEVDVKTMTANDEPVSVEGKLVIKRNWWTDPVVISTTGEKRSVLRDEEVLPGDKVLTPGHYEEGELFTKFVKTDTKGEALIDFQPDRDGYYVLEFTGYDTDGTEIKSSTTLYVCDKQSKDIGFRYGGLQIIAEKDTFKLGETARVMLVADRPGTWVLLTVEAEEILTQQMIHLDGPVKLVEVPITDTFIPNVFFTAVSGNDYQLKNHELPIVVPPEDKFLNVLVSSNKEEYGPREEAAYELTVTDKTGKPVATEVSLGITDAAVYYIQNEYAPDIRQFFYGKKRNHSIQTQTSFYQKPYMRLVRSDENVLMTEGEKLKQNKKGGLAGFEVGAIGGAVDDLSSLDKEVGLRRDEVGAKDMRAMEQSFNGPVSRMAAAKTAAPAMLNETKSLPASAPHEVAEAVGMPGQGKGNLATAQVRSDFRSTVLWQPAVMTDANGKAKVSVKFPDSLTTWRATARAITTQTVVGNITHETRTKQDIIVRLQAPRFFTERDQVTVSANVHNYTDKEQQIKVTLDAKGLKVNGEPVVWVTLPADSEKRVDWETVAEAAGSADLTVMAQTETISDAMQRVLPVIPHGIEKFIAQAVALKSDGADKAAEFTLDIPKERIPGSTWLRLNLSPSLAAGMLDALPYLADYPYGCVEQTMSRFLPAVIVRKTMRDLGFSEKDANDYIEHVLNPREDPKGHPQRREDQTLPKLDEMVKDGLQRVYDMQHSDGGWGWWKEGDSDRFMSAYVVWGLGLAQQAGVNIRGDVLANGINYVQNQLVEEENDPDMLAWMLHALAQAERPGTSDQRDDRQTERLWEMRDKLNSYTRALFALSEHYRGHKDRAATLARNLVNGIKEDKDNGTAHWGETGIYYRWSEGGEEATAFNIKALANIDPAAPQLATAVKWMVLNRRGARWSNTRDTAISILGLADYLKTTTELTPDYEYDILVNGRSVGKGKVNADNLFTFDRYIELPNDALADGKNTVSIAMKGKGALYVAGYLSYFTLEEGIKAAGNEVFVDRKYFREDKRPTLLKGYISEWKPLADGDKVKSGDRIRVEITLEAKNNYEYLIVEDHKPAGAEAVELRSGAGSADFLDFKGKESEATPIYQEFRDQKAAFFLAKVKQGKHRIRYELRAEAPGEFHAMPNQAHAMYVPEIRANSDEARMTIEDNPVPTGDEARP